MAYESIKIEKNTEESKEKIFSAVKRFCVENFQEFKLSIEGTELNYEQKRKSETN